MVNDLINFSTMLYIFWTYFPILIAGELYNNKDISFRVISFSEPRLIQLIGQFSRRYFDEPHFSLFLRKSRFTPCFLSSYATRDPWLIQLDRQLSPTRGRRILKIIHDRAHSRLDLNRLRIVNSRRTARFGMPFDFGVASNRGSMVNLCNPQFAILRFAASLKHARPY